MSSTEEDSVFHKRYAQCKWRFVFNPENPSAFSLNHITSDRLVSCLPRRRAQPLFEHHTPGRHREEALAVFYTVLTQSATQHLPRVSSH